MSILDKIIPAHTYFQKLWRIVIIIIFAIIMIYCVDKAIEQHNKVDKIIQDTKRSEKEHLQTLRDIKEQGKATGLRIDGK